MWMPLIERSTSRGINLGFMVGSSISLYLCSVSAVTTLSSFMAKFCPMQFLRKNDKKNKGAKLDNDFLKVID